VALGEVGAQRRQRPGVGLEHPVERGDVVVGVRRGHHVRVAVVAPPAAGAVVVGDVAGGLLQVRRQPPPLDQLGEQVGGLLHGDVRAAELGHRVVAVLAEDPLVEALGAAALAAAPLAGRRRQVAGELVDQQPAQALGAARVAREERTLDDLGQAGQREHRPVEVGDVAGEQLPLVGGELLHHVGVAGLARRTARVVGRAHGSGQSRPPRPSRGRRGRPRRSR
jgi:hypothetical protein